MNKFKRNAPAILSIFSIAGVALTAYFASKDGVEADKALKVAEKEKGEPLTTGEKIKVAGPKYIRTITVATATALCSGGSTILSYSNQKTLAVAYPLLEKSYEEFKQTTKRVAGQETYDRIMDEITKTHCEPADLYAPGLCCCSSLGVYDSEIPEPKRIFYDTVSEQTFVSTLSDVIQAEYHLIRNLNLGMEPTAEEYFEFLGLDPEAEPFKRFKGYCWHVWDNEMMTIGFNHRLVIFDDGSEVIRIEPEWMPYLDSQD